LSGRGIPTPASKSQTTAETPRIRPTKPATAWVKVPLLRSSSHSLASRVLISPVNANLDSVERSELTCLSRVDLMRSLITGRVAAGRTMAMSAEATSSSGSRPSQ